MLALTGFLMLASAVYVPSSGGAAAVELTNRAETTLLVTVDVLGAAPGRTERISLAPGESVAWSGAADGFSSLEINAEGPVDVHARGRVIDGSALTTAGSIRIGKSIGAWTAGVAVVNPDSVDAILSVSVQGRENSTRSIYVPARATKVIDSPDGEWLSFTASRPVLVVAYDVNAHSGAQVFGAATPLRRRGARKGSPELPTPTLQTVVLTPSKDNTLFESANGSLSNGAGIHLFAGLTAQPGRRRALLAFDVASQIPPGSQITRASLAMNVSMTVIGEVPMRLHRVTADWGEGPSDAGPAQDGDGAPARANDATWIHTFSPNSRWTNAGGDFAPTADATALAGSSAFTWQSSADMVARVQDWLNRSTSNFGWIIIGAEATLRSAKRLDSREIGGATRPMLTIEFSR